MEYKTTYSKRWAKFCGWMLNRLGWTADGDSMPEDKAVVLGVPHTSAWDFVISYLFYSSFGKVAHCVIKKEFFFWPVGPILRACGCIPVDRSSATAMVKGTIEAMNSQKVFHLAIAPEGTRKAIKTWKTGFHMIARETGASVYLGYFDWKTKHIGCGVKFELTSDAKADLKKIQAYYETLGLVGKNPEGYVTH